MPVLRHTFVMIEFNLVKVPSLENYIGVVLYS